MGFDNECILNIQSLAGEYFCPVCRTLVYPHEALQTQCTHLYCKPCLTYVVGSTQACPYDGYLVTEAGSKPLMESNKALAETIGKTNVHCLYHRSGCVWQGPLSECTSHCSGCAFGNSPVVCNRCGLQIVHRQVQEHAQTCNVNGTNSQPQGSDTAQDAAVSVDQSKIANQTAAPASQPHQVASQPQTATAPSNIQNLNQTPPTNPPPQVAPATAVPAPEQWYQQQQYQQYYQQYPGYDPYQQQTYQQYYPYQQQPQNQPPVQPQPQSQPQIQAPIQPQSQIQPQPQPQAQGPPQFQMHSQAQPQIPSNVQTQPLYSQAAVVGSSQNQGQVNPQQQVHPGGQIQSQNQPLAHGHMPPQSYAQVQPHLVQSHAQSLPQPQMQVPQYQQPHSQMHYSQPPQVLPQSHPQAHPPFQPLPLPPPQPQPMNPQHPPVQSVAGHPSYSSQPHQPIQHAPPMQVQPPTGSLPSAQFPQPPPHMRPTQPPHMLPSQPPPTHQQHVHPHNQPGLPAHPRPIVHQVQQPTPQQYVQQPQAFPGQPSGQLHHAGPFAQGPPQPMQQPSLGFVQQQQVTALPHSMPPQSYMGRPPMLNQGGQSQQFTQPQSSGVPPHARPPQFGPSQPSVNQSNVNMTNQPHVYPEQQLNQYAPPLGGAMVDRKGNQTFERRVEQEEHKSPSLKKSDSVSSEFRANFNEVKPETGINDELKTGNGGEDDHRKDEKDAVSELHQVQGVPGDSGTIQRVKEESKDGVSDHNKAEDGGVAIRDSMKQGEAQSSSEVDNGSLAIPPGSSTQQGHHERTFSQSQTPPQGQIGDVSGGFPSKGMEQSSHPAPLIEQERSPHPQVPYPPSGQQQRPAGTAQTPGHPPIHLRPPGHGYLPHGPHPGEHFQPPGSFHPDFPLGGPPNNSSRGYEPQYNQGQSHGRLNRMSQGEPLGPPPPPPALPHGPDGQNVPRHPGPMESDIYHDQRPSHFDSRRPDSHIPGNVDRGPYPFGAESNSMRTNGAPPPGLDSRDEKFRTPDTFPMGPTRHHEQGRLFPGPPHLGREDSPKYGSRSSRPLGGYGMDGPSRFFDKDPHGYGFDAPGSGGYLPPYHPNDSGGRPLHHDDNRGRFGNNRQNPDFHGPMHAFGRHHMDHIPRNPSRSFGGGPHDFDVDGREMERHSAGERFGPPGHMPRSGEPFGLRNREPGFGSFQDYGHSGEPNGPGGFSHKPPFGAKSARPHLGEPGFRSSYSRKGFPSDGGFFSGGSDSFDGLRKRKTYSMGWCRICKIDCESVEGLDMHGQTHEHQRMAMDMVISIKQKNAKKHKASSNDHSAREEPSKLRNTEVHARVNAS